MRRVAYLWSPELMAVADELPANHGRSRMVHGLVRALGLVEFGAVQEYASEPEEAESTLPDEEGEGVSSPPPPDEEDPTPPIQDGRTTPQHGNDTAGNGELSDLPRDGPSVRVVAPDPLLCDASELRRYHDASYVDYLLYGRGSDSDEDFKPRKKRRKDKTHKLGLEYDCPPFPELGRYASLVAGSTLTACRMLARGEADVSIVWDGGRHHAGRAKASGFCYVADAVLGIQLLCREGVARPPSPSAGLCPTPPPRRPRVMYLDLDLHYGDGVARAFACPTHFAHPLTGRPRPPQVLTLSVHHASPLFFPPGAPPTSTADTAHPFNLALGLAEHAGPGTYARLWASVERVRAAWAPDYVVLQLGVDGLPRDPIGQVGAWAVHGPGSVAWVVDQILAWRVPTALLGGGGYDHANAARAWATATAAAVGREVGPGTDVPEHAGMSAFAPGFTLAVEPSNVPDKTRAADLDAADAAFGVIAGRIAEIRALQA